MGRWYIGYYASGRHSAHKKVEDFSKRVNYYHLGELISHICLEKNAFNQKEYLFFIGFENEEFGQIPNSLYPRFENLIADMGFRDVGMSNEPQTYEQIATVVDKEIEIERVLQVKVWRPQKTEHTEPYNYVSIDDSVLDGHLNLSPKYNQLLYWLSVYGRGTWQQFRSICAELSLDENGKYSSSIIRRLRLLGHVELARNGQVWFIAPPCFVETPSPERVYQVVLAGQRTPSLLQHLQEFTQIEHEPQPNDDAPETIRAYFSNREEVETFIGDFRQKYYSMYIANQASINIASTLPDLFTWEHNLPTLAVVQGYYQFEKWSGSGFQMVSTPHETGMYRLTHRTDRFEHPQMTLYYDAGRNDWRKGDWYGLRYLMLKRTGMRCEFDYNHNLRRLTIDMNLRLPDLYERALVLASGRLPLFRNNQIIFGEISDELSHIIANKLEAKLIESKGI